MREEFFWTVRISLTVGFVMGVFMGLFIAFLDK